MLYIVFLFSGNIQLTCIKHIGTGENLGNLKSFNSKPQFWLKAKSAATGRKLKGNVSKYDAIIAAFQIKILDHHGYHSACCKTFTSIRYTENLISTTSPSSNVTTRSKIPVTAKASKSGVLPATCIFCDKSRKKVSGKWEEISNNERHDAEVTVRYAAETLNDESLLLKLGTYKFGEGPGFVAKEVRYHQTCKRSYLNKSRNILKSKDKTTSKFKRAKASAFTNILQHIEIDVIDKNIPEFTLSILDRFRDKFILEG